MLSTACTKLHVASHLMPSLQALPNHLEAQCLKSWISIVLFTSVVSMADVLTAEGFELPADLFHLVGGWLSIRRVADNNPTCSGKTPNPTHPWRRPLLRSDSIPIASQLDADLSKRLQGCGLGIQARRAHPARWLASQSACFRTGQMFACQSASPSAPPAVRVGSRSLGSGTKQ